MYSSMKPSPSRQANFPPRAKPAAVNSQARVNPVWRKLALSQSADALEREADAAAEQVMRMPSQFSAAPLLQRKCAACAEEDEKLRRKEGSAGQSGGMAPPSVQQALGGPSQPLDSATRAYFEPRFGQDFGAVRVRQGPTAAQSAREVGAHAYTVGRDIVFAAGQFAPETSEGRHLLAHELAHVVQQRAGATVAIQRKGLDLGAKYEVRTPEKGNLMLRVHPNAERYIGGDKTKLNTVGNIKSGTVATLKEEREYGWYVVEVETIEYGVRTGFVHQQYLFPVSAEKSEPAPAPDTENAGAKAAGTAGDPLQRPAADIMADDKYIDKNIKKMEFYAAEEAHVFYSDGSKLELGLVPAYIKDPIEGVDYRTPRATHISVASSEPGALKYIPRGQEVKAPANAKYGDVLATLTRTVTFKTESASKRIVPTQVNTLTAPTLCQMLMEAENEYGKLMDATSKGGVKVFESFKTVLEIYSFLPGAGIAKAAGTKAATTAATASEGMLGKLVKKLTEVLAKGGVAKEILVEGVALGDVVIGRKGTALAVEYTFIENVGRVAGQGRAMQIALEQAAVQIAKANGVAEAQVIVHTVVNPKWLAYLESLGYTKTLVEKAGQFGFEGVWMKVMKVPG